MLIALPRPETWIRTTSAGLYCEPISIDPQARGARRITTVTAITPARGMRGCSPRRTPWRCGSAMARRRHVAASRHGEVTGGRCGLGGFTGRACSAALNRTRLSRRSVVASATTSAALTRTCAPSSPRGDSSSPRRHSGPVFRHPPDRQRSTSWHFAGASSRALPCVGLCAGKCQRVLALLRQAGYEKPVYLHGALIGLTELYESLGVSLGPVLPLADVSRDALRGRIVLAPPAATTDRWSRRLPDPVVAMASGWMRVRQRAKARGVELPLVISDHADWDELTATIDEVAAEEIWVTHGREEALVHYARQKGYRAAALALTGFEEDE